MSSNSCGRQQPSSTPIIAIRRQRLVGKRPYPTFSASSPGHPRTQACRRSSSVKLPDALEPARTDMVYDLSYSNCGVQAWQEHSGMIIYAVGKHSHRSCIQSSTVYHMMPPCTGNPMCRFGQLNQHPEFFISHY